MLGKILGFDHQNESSVVLSYFFSIYMPLSEFHPVTKSKLESSQPQDPPSTMLDGDFMELLWENGQIVMQAQTNNRPKKSPLSRIHDKDIGDGSKSRSPAAVDAPTGDFAPAIIPGNISFATHQEDDLSPWLNYPIDDYYSELLSEFSGFNPSSFVANSTPVDKGTTTGSFGLGQVARDSYDEEPQVPRLPADAGRSRPNQCTNPQQWQSSMQSGRPRSVEFGGAGSSIVSGPPVTSTSTSVINFSHFSRAATLLKSSLHNGGRSQISDKPIAVASNHQLSTPIASPGIRRSTAYEHSGSALHPAQELASGPGVSEVGGKRLPETQKSGHVKRNVEKMPESIVAPSSVCSVNSDAVESGDPTQRGKRKAIEEESGYQSEDVDDESMGAKKSAAARVPASKRSRAAEVHNLSERRRRDRINEKMRALQELIPNCNKADKASMLDEAIEYLKTLQLQVQIMSMGGGLCMPPMMAAMQRMHPHHMAHFPPMGIGIGYGMGMLDMNGNPLLSQLPMANPQFPCMTFGSPSGLRSMTTTTSPVFGVPSQGIPIPMHCGPPFVPLTAHPTVPGNAPEIIPPAAGLMQADPVCSKDQYRHGIASETNARQGNPRASVSTQPKKECVEQSSSAPTNDQASNSDDCTNLSSGNGNSSSGASYD